MTRGNASGAGSSANYGAQGPRSPMEDTASPYFLYNGDHPGLVLVSHQLTGSNYNTWNRAMLMALTAKNKLGFVNGTIPRPSETDLLFGAWSRCNSMVTSWILNAVAKDIADSLLYIDSAMDVWGDLHDRFHQSNGPRVFQIKKQLLALSQGSLDANSYYTRLKILWDELKDFRPVPVCKCGGMKSWMDYQQQEYVMQFLMGLNESYAQIRAQILMMDPLPPITKVFVLVVQEERQRDISSSISSVSEAMAFNSKNQFTQTISAAASSFKPKRDRPVCTHCGVLGHTIDKCYKLHGYPPGYKTQPKIQSTKSFANQTSLDGCAFSPPPSISAEASSVGSLTPIQCQQLIALLSSQLNHSESQSPGPSVSNFTGPYTGQNDWDG